MPMVNGQAVDLEPGPRPPNGGRWVQGDWETDYLSPTPGFSTWRDAIVVTRPEEWVEAVDTVGAECHRECDVPESGDDVNNAGHSGSWSRSVQQGWSIGGSLSGDIEVTKAAKIAAGVSGSYSESETTSLTLNYAFPHCDKDDHWRTYAQPVLRARREWSGKVYRYFLNARGKVMEGHPRRDGKVVYDELVPFTNYIGSIQITHEYHKLGRVGFVDRPCDEWEEVIPGAAPQRAAASNVSLPNDLRNWEKYSAKDAGRMMAIVRGRAGLSDLTLEALRVILDGDTEREKQLLASIEPAEPGDITLDADPFQWVLRNRAFILGLPEEHRRAIRRQLGASSS